MKRVVGKALVCERPQSPIRLNQPRLHRPVAKKSHTEAGQPRCGCNMRVSATSSGSLWYTGKTPRFALQVFFGSSNESVELMEEIASWLQEENDVDILLWTDRRAFPVGSCTLPRLFELTTIVDAAIFMFGEDDK